jgi:RHS repeat-associated protein
MSHNTMNRLTTISYDVSQASGVASTPSVNYNYDNSSSSSTKGLLLSITMTSGGSTIYTESFSYDLLDRLQHRSWTRDGRTYTIGYDHNSAGQLTKLTHPSGRQVGMNHDGKGRLVSMTEPNGGTPVPTYMSNITYNPAGQVTGTSLGNGVNETFGYEANRMQLTTQTATKGSTSLMNLTYGYQAAAGQMGAGTTAGNSGQLVSISGTINGTTESAGYSYDNVGRLVTSSQTSNGQSAQRRFAYDRWGNRTGMWDAVSGGNQIQTIALVQSAGAPTNQIQSVTSGGATKNHAYDAAGNVTNDGTHTYAYDAENRLESVDGGSTGQYFYDYQNRRVKKVVGSASTHYTWEGSQVLCEYNATTGGQITDYVYLGSRLLAEGPGNTIGGNGTVTYALSDRLSVRMLLNKFGSVIGQQAHLPFGEDFAESGTQEKHHFTSYERDSETGTDYAINRGYSLITGRFSRVDPLNKSAKSDYPQSWNRYSYAANESIGGKDPKGLDTGWGSSDFLAPRMKRQVILFPWEADPCESQGASYFLDGADMYSGFFCGGALPDLLSGFLGTIVPGTILVESECQNSIYHPEGKPGKGEVAWRPAGSGRVACDAVATPRGIVKIPDGCDCDVTCSGGHNYQIDCDCAGVRWFVFQPEVVVPGPAGGFKDPREEGWYWVPDVSDYTRSNNSLGAPPPLGHLNLFYTDHWTFS